MSCAMYVRPTIDCDRCHGPGSLASDWKLRSLTISFQWPRDQFDCAEFGWHSECRGRITEVMQPSFQFLLTVTHQLHQWWVNFALDDWLVSLNRSRCTLQRHQLRA